ncbi:MAG TPA: CBS domain-containing protein [Thermoguttaceae bacterium]|nr:CBS domain-containing protein [Thermoguttaceae bacterium]
MSDKSLHDVRFARAGDVMTKEVISIEGTATVADAVRLMRERKVSSVFVNRRSQEDAWGIITRKDVVCKVIDPGKDPAEVKVFEIMSKPLITVSPGLALKYCARLFNSAGIRRAPVFDGKDIVGILSNTDIFNAIQV